MPPPPPYTSLLLHSTAAACDTKKEEEGKRSERIKRRREEYIQNICKINKFFKLLVGGSLEFAACCQSSLEGEGEQDRLGPEMTLLSRLNRNSGLHALMML